MAFKIVGKDMYPIFVLTKCCWSIHSKVVRLGKHVHSKQGKTIATQTLQFHDKFMCIPCYFSIHRVHFFNMIWYGPKSGKVQMQKRQKNCLKYTDRAELKKITIRIQ